MHTYPRYTGVLPFANKIFDKHLNPVNIVTEVEATNSTDRHASTYRDVTHWHTPKKLSTKPPSQVPDKLALRRDQWFARDIQAYSASLTNAVGNVLEPETIITKKPLKKVSNAKSELETNNAKSKGNIVKGKQPVKQNQTGGKLKAFEAAAEIAATKQAQKAKTATQNWEKICLELQRGDDAGKQHNEAQKYLNGLAEEAKIILEPEVELFSVLALLRLYRKDNSLDILALVWSAFLRIQKFPAPVNPELASQVEIFAKQLNFPTIQLNKSLENRSLPFSVSQSAPVHSLDAKKFQLEYCGPYFDRAIDSIADKRVSGFEPDMWQTKVLDAIDENKSLFVVAPTSAGKTFISFYAMKKVLESDDDSLLVYLAPTKALVNQVVSLIRSLGVMVRHECLVRFL
jgi:superfamily II RNA helicase